MVRELDPILSIVVAESARDVVAVMVGVVRVVGGTVVSSPPAHWLAPLSPSCPVEALRRRGGVTGDLVAFLGKRRRVAGNSLQMLEVAPLGCCDLV